MPAWRALLTSSGWRVRMAAMPPRNAYPAHRNAMSNAKEPKTSTAVRLPHRALPSGALQLHCAGLCRIGLAVATGRGFVFRRALGLHVLGYKAAVISQAAFDQRLRFVDKRVRQRFAADITHGQQLPLTREREV